MNRRFYVLAAASLCFLLAFSVVLRFQAAERRGAALADAHDASADYIDQATGQGCELAVGIFGEAVAAGQGGCGPCTPWVLPVASWSITQGGNSLFFDPYNGSGNAEISLNQQAGMVRLNDASLSLFGANGTTMSFRDANAGNNLALLTDLGTTGRFGVAQVAPSAAAGDLTVTNQGGSTIGTFTNGRNYVHAATFYMSSDYFRPTTSLGAITFEDSAGNDVASISDLGTEARFSVYEAQVDYITPRGGSVVTIEDPAGNDMATFTDGGTVGNMVVTGTATVNGTFTVGVAGADNAPIVNLLSEDISLDIAGLIGPGCTELAGNELTVTGADAGDPCKVGFDSDLLDANYEVFCHVTAADTVRLKKCCWGTCADPSAVTFTVTVTDVDL